ncbi:MAG: ECF transporter S component [Coriobacteriales bacterium]|jgi:hypothetical protein|nr:ECF transporter S component [Coriobacteriales bacterium]
MTTPGYYLPAIGIILVAFILMAVRFEGRRPRAREVVVLSVMCALAVAGRAAFFMLPQFKPVAAIVIITGVALGAESGFLVGTLAAFVSNFLFGQGPWTPFQMLAFGLVGFIAGLLFHRRDRGMQLGVAGEVDTNRALSSSDITSTLSALTRSKRVDFVRILMLCIYGGLSVTVLYGLIVDIFYLLMFSESVSTSTLLAVLASGLPFNIIHGVATVFFLVVLAHPMIEKLERVKIKFGLMTGRKRPAVPLGIGDGTMPSDSVLGSGGKAVLSTLLALLLVGTLGLSDPTVAIADTDSQGAANQQTSDDAGAEARDRLIEASRTGEKVTFWVGSDPNLPDYTWTFDGLLLDPYQAERLPPLKLDITIIEQALSNRDIDTITLEFAWQGDLPVPADIAVRLPSALADVSWLALYRLDESAGNYELYQDNLTREGGYAHFTIVRAEPLVLSVADLAGSSPGNAGITQPGSDPASEATMPDAEPDGSANTSLDVSSGSGQFRDVLPWLIVVVLAAVLVAVIVVAALRRRQAKAVSDMDEGWLKGIPSINELMDDAADDAEDSAAGNAVDGTISGAIDDVAGDAVDDVASDAIDDAAGGTVERADDTGEPIGDIEEPRQ